MRIKTREIEKGMKIKSNNSLKIQKREDMMKAREEKMRIKKE